MKEENFGKHFPGRLTRTPERALAFVPNPLPPTVEPTNDLMMSLGEARAALGELSGVGRLLPNPYLLIRPFLHKEAEASSRIEGTETDLDELFIHEVDPTRRPERADARQEVLNYVGALETGLKNEMPISLNFVKGLHFILMQGVRGQNRAPGEFRRIQNRIGGASAHDAAYVPPPVPEMLDCISDWERFLHADPQMMPLVRIALLHYQFEAIHPFIG